MNVSQTISTFAFAAIRWWLRSLAASSCIWPVPAVDVTLAEGTLRSLQLCSQPTQFHHD